MNLTASKVLLGLSVAAYAYCTWDHIMPSKKPDAEPAKPIALTAAMVNRTETLSIGRDVFESTLIDRGVGEANALPGDDGSDADPTVAGATPGAAGTTAGGAGMSAVASEFSLQGIFMTPEGHAALISGTPVTEGEVTTIASTGAKILATKIGEDYAIIVCRRRTQVLKLSDPSVASASAASSNSNSSNSSSSPSTGSNPPPSATAHPNGWSDPYAGHRTVHH